MTTEEWLMEKFGPTLTIDDMAEALKMAPGTVRNHLYSGRLQIVTYRQGKHRVAAAAAVATYLERRRQQANEEHEEARP